MKVNDQGDIYFSDYTGPLLLGCERFYTERELVDGKCPDHQTEPVEISEANYFFRMSKYQGWLIDYIQRNPEFIRPERYRNEVLSFLKDPWRTSASHGPRQGSAGASPCPLMRTM